MHRHYRCGRLVEPSIVARFLAWLVILTISFSVSGGGGQFRFPIDGFGRGVRD